MVPFTRAALFAVGAVTLLLVGLQLHSWWFAAAAVVLLSRATWLATTETPCPSP